ncbi:hypothetical protein GPL06_10135 [Bacteroides salyersiae]|uniref:hypothetical protein n=1 Tax=Bacteroides salyersiae TaxID=291644 RepID=UPI001C030DB3|nr:hypothetical protein [Bacteroides salyersiae]MBT9873165.1 hypothetical protein [Bacteroides salyersiae]
MKCLILTLLFILIYCDKSDAQLSTFEHEYIYEFAIKRPGRVNLGFLIVERDKYQEILFDIRFSKDKIDKVNKTVRILPLNNKVVERSGDFYYNSDDFVKKHRLIPDNIYRMISSSFLEITNKERLQILNELFCASNKKNK